ncbi:MAG: YraN family protein [Fusicatenibacter sp.]|nr:YraN family protein [Lachnospiraceae bacterium]MDY2936802.1 YraN family protein [Fusicatenibacter sp.]
MNKRKIGKEQEDRAAAHLESLGYRILEKNFCCRFGEIDLIAEQEDYLVFVEVKYRTDPQISDPASAVNYKKQQRISRTADYYRVRCKIASDRPCRFDVVAETPDEIRVYQNAFPYRGNGW